MKIRLDRETVAFRAARELRDGWYVNLGFGIPTLISNLILPDKTLFFHGENGILGFGPIQSQEEADACGWIYVNGGGQPVEPGPYMSVFDYVEAFDIIRGGHLDAAVLGAFQVSEHGDIANWRLPTYKGEGGTIGGSMDLAIGAKHVIVTMHHTDASNRPRIVKECSMDLTGRRCVHTIITDLAVLRVTETGLLLEEIAPGWTVEEIQALTEPKLIVPDTVRVMEL